MSKKYPLMDFINRESEQRFLLDYFKNEPRNILFLYGPKSCGKTALIRKVIKKLDEKKFAISFFNMRETMTQTAKDLKKLFFPSVLKNFINRVFSGLSVGTSSFSWKIGEEKMLDTHLFKMIVDKATEAKKKGVQYAIVLDEFQYLKDVYLDKEKEISIINELFKFFIALTKQNNLAHVVCLTSDSYYMEELYNDTKLSNTSDFQLIDHLVKDDIYYWLGEKEKCPTAMVDAVWENLGGSVWEIWQVFVAFRNTGDYQKKIDDLLQVKFSLIAEYYFQNWVYQDGDEVEKKQFIKVSKILIRDGKYEIQEGDKKILGLIKKLVEKDLWFFDTKMRVITANSRSVQIGIGRLMEEMS